MDLTPDLLLSILFIGIILNTALIVGLVVSGRFGRRGNAVASTGHASAIDRTLSTSYVDNSARASWPEPGSASAAIEAPAEDEAPAALTAVPVVAAADADPEPEPAVAVPDVEATSTTTERLDPLTGLRDAASFATLVALEEARVARYRRPATIVVLELDGLDRLVERLGPDAGDRIVPALADTIRRLARGSDIVARLGPGRFGILLSETDEVAAINYVERVRRACELWLESGAMAMRLAIGWAGTNGETSLADAQRQAVERMYAELRRAARRDAADAPAAPGDGAASPSTDGGDAGATTAAIADPTDEAPPAPTSLAS